MDFPRTSSKRRLLKHGLFANRVKAAPQALKSRLAAERKMNSGLSIGSGAPP
jgi:hypothetical protein